MCQTGVTGVGDAWPPNSPKNLYFLRLPVNIVTRAPYGDFLVLLAFCHHSIDPQWIREQSRRQMYHGMFHRQIVDHTVLSEFPNIQLTWKGGGGNFYVPGRK